MNMKKLSILVFLFSSSFGAVAQSTKQVAGDVDSSFRFRGVAELGFLGVLDHKIQFSKSGTYFNYREDGGQDVLFPVSRLSVELDYNDRNTIVFLYQPLRLESQVLLEDDLVVDGLVFPANTNVNLLYNFPFYRISYLRELLPNNNKYKFAIGGSLQIRNATISFESADGTLFRTNRDIGPVPALKLRGRANLNPAVYLELESDGMYAPVSYLNGSDNEVVGAILDASLRSGVRIKAPFSAFLNLRYLGGGAVGTSDDDTGPGDGYTRNWLHFSTVSIGFIYEWE
jgi:hypothetical protein